MLTSAEARLVKIAQDLIARRQGNDDHTVASAALDSAGNVHTGLNVAHFTGGPCAELVVIGQAAATSDHLPLTTIVAALDNGRGVIPPCGRCRQVLFDYFPDIRVIVEGHNGLEPVAVTDLLPYVFDWRALDTQRVHFDPAYLDGIRAGSTTSTIRYQDPVRRGPATLVFEVGDGEVTIDAEVTGVEAKRLNDLDAADAARDGFADHAGLLAALERHYPGIPSDAEVLVVRFILAGDGAAVEGHR